MDELVNSSKLSDDSSDVAFAAETSSAARSDSARAENSATCPAEATPGSPASATAVAERREDLIKMQLDAQRLHIAELLRVKLAWAKLLWLLAFLAVLLAVAFTVPYLVEQIQYASTRGRQRAEHELAQVELKDSPLGQLSRGYQMVSQFVGPSVVHIHTIGSDTDLLSTGLPLRRPGFGRMPTEGQGSGFIADADGHVVTNYHVIRDAREIQVALSDGRRSIARVVGYDKETDLAVLKISGEKLIPARWGNSDATEVGSLVWAVGSPFGLERSITSGILSAKHRAGMAGTPYQDFLQSDAAVNPGNSGGPLVDIHGEVVGVNTAIVGDAYQGISFAIPSNEAKSVYQRLIGDGEIRRGWLGVALDAVTPERAKELSLAKATGAFVASVVDQPGMPSPAAEAGIQVGDLVLSWNGKEVTDPATLSILVAKTGIGSKAQVAILRDGVPATLEVTVGERPKQ